MERFKPSPAKLVRFVDEKGQVAREAHLNRKQRRRLGIRRAG